MFVWNALNLAQFFRISAQMHAVERDALCRSLARPQKTRGREMWNATQTQDESGKCNIIIAHYLQLSNDLAECSSKLWYRANGQNKNAKLLCSERRRTINMLLGLEKDNDIRSIHRTPHTTHTQHWSVCMPMEETDIVVRLQAKQRKIRTSNNQQEPRSKGLFYICKMRLHTYAQYAIGSRKRSMVALLLLAIVRIAS